MIIDNQHNYTFTLLTIVLVCIYFSCYHLRFFFDLCFINLFGVGVALLLTPFFLFLWFPLSSLATFLLCALKK